MTVPPIRVLLDVDAGIDDALALLYATATPRLDVVGVSAVVGNVPVDLGARNAARVLAAVGEAAIPVVRGAAVTSDGDGPRRGPTNHGPDGLGGVTVDVDSPVSEPGEGVSALLDRLAVAGPLTVAACAPLTNVAHLVRRKGVERTVLVGGALVRERQPEFNVGHDPTAAAAVLTAGVPVTVLPAEVFESVAVPQALVSRLQEGTTPAARLTGELLRVRRAHLLGDAVVLVFLSHPELFEVSRRRLAVVDGRLVPVEHVQGGAVVEVITAVDATAVVETFVQAVEGCLSAAAPRPRPGRG